MSTHGVIVDFDWSEAKNKINICKHGIDFVDVKEMFDHPMLTLLDDREDYGEDRWIGIGWIQALICVVVYVERRNNLIRIISARKATRYEVHRYEQKIKN